MQKIGKRYRIFVRAGRRVLAFQVPKAADGYFFIAHKGKTLSLGYDVLDACLPQLGDYRRVNRLVTVASGTVTSEQWWRRLQRKPAAAAAARKAFVDYVEGPFRK